MNVAKFVNVRNLPVLINVVTISEEVEDPIHAHLESDFVDSNPGNDSNA